MDKVTAATVEIWFWFFGSMATVVARFAARRIHAGRWSLHVDDWLMLAVVFLFAASMATDQVYIVLDNRFDSSSDNWEHEYALLSILVLLYDHLSLAATWLCKACMLIILHCLTLNLKQNYAIKATAVYTGLSYLFIMITFIFVWCRPQRGYLELEPENDQCMWPVNHLISIAVFNVTSDFFILAITIPLLLKARLPLHKKVTIVGMFSLGIITIVITLLNRILAITQTDFDLPTWNIRETGMSVIVSNLPLTLPLWHRISAKTSTYISHTRHNTSHSDKSNSCNRWSDFDRRASEKSAGRSRPASAIIKLFRLSRADDKQSQVQSLHSRYGNASVVHAAAAPSSSQNADSELYYLDNSRKASMTSVNKAASQYDYHNYQAQQSRHYNFHDRWDHHRHGHVDSIDMVDVELGSGAESEVQTEVSDFEATTPSEGGYGSSRSMLVALRKDNSGDSIVDEGSGRPVSSASSTSPDRIVVMRKLEVLVESEESDDEGRRKREQDGRSTEKSKWRKLRDRWR